MRTDLALAALASAAVPGMKPVSVAGIGPTDEGRGSELQSALVEDATGRRWVVRAPLNPVAGARLQRNDELVRQLSRHVPFKVPAAVGYAPLGKDGSAAVYPYVEGAPLDLRRLPAGPGLASAVGRAVAAIHNVPRALFEEQDVPLFDAGGARQRAIAEVDRAAETGRVPTGLLARWEEAFEAAPLWQFATTPVHGAFTGGSVVVAFTDEEDSATGRVVAVTDWDEAMVGDPAVDLAELWSQSSRQAWEAVLDSYTLARSHRPDPYLPARARLVAEMRSLRGLARAVAEDDEDSARRAVEVLRRVDRLTEADQSLVPATARPSGSRPSPPAAAVQPVDGPSPEGSGPGTPAAAWAEEGTDAATQDGTTHEEADLTMEVPSPTGTEPAGRRDDAELGGLAGQDEEQGPDGPQGHSEASGHDDEPATPDDGIDEDATIQIDVGRDDAAAEHPPGDELDRPAPSTSRAGMTEDAPEAGGTDDPLAHDPVPLPDGSHLPADADDPVDGSAGGVGDPELRDPERPDPELTDPDVASRPQEPDDLEDEERLHELYGMPAPERDADGG